MPNAWPWACFKGFCTGRSNLLPFGVCCSPWLWCIRTPQTVTISKRKCPPGTYGADPDRLVCDICPGGYVCLGTTITATPTSAEEDGGFLCTKGHYCPQGSYEEIACAPGSYNSKNGSSAASDCIVCPADHYQVRKLDSLHSE